MSTATPESVRIAVDILLAVDGVPALQRLSVNAVLVHALVDDFS